ncbi:hypothetical protein BKA80DRAFT_275701 [Phyllosticta citrichinensis]
MPFHPSREAALDAKTEIRTQESVIPSIANQFSSLAGSKRGKTRQNRRKESAATPGSVSSRRR